jgi:hypothetical protein
VPTQQLQVMVKNLRSECGHALSVAQGTNQLNTLQYLLARTQEELWTAFVWPDLVVRADTLMSPGQFLYNFPATMPFDAIRSAWVANANSTNWGPLDYGIDENLILPGGGNSSRADPPQKWDVETTQFRVWPTPDSNQYTVRFKGNKPLAAFVADTDVSTLDATCIVLFAAAELLARAKAEDAPGKAQKAQRHLQKLLGNKVSAKNKVTTIGSGSPDRRLLNENIRVGAGG